MVANVNGVLTKEWKGASKKSLVVLIISLSILIIGVLIIAQGNYMKIQESTTQLSAAFELISQQKLS